ncbi:hypothetical protein [Candidatus Electronema sp. PJ]|uniref:hypothetical protein n=1 Tax=Candidatus Electronema sp. PJ TaxID=3401572 RepID=UPI003AA816B3
MTTVLRSLGAAALLLLTGGLTGCGYKTLPVAPSAMIPRPVTDLSYELTGNGAVLRWTFPDRTASGEKLTELDSFQLYRAEVPVEDYCETCPIPFAAPITVAGGSLPNKGSRQGSWEDAPMQPGRKYFFKLRSRTGWLSESDDSNLITFVWEKPSARPKQEAAPAAAVDRTPPQVPSNVTAARTASAVKVFWDAGEDKDLAGHKVYRRVGEGKPELLGEVKAPYNLYEDKNPPAKEVKVFYSVSSFDQSSPPNESKPSAEASLR